MITLSFEFDYVTNEEIGGYIYDSEEVDHLRKLIAEKMEWIKAFGKAEYNITIPLQQGGVLVKKGAEMEGSPEYNLSLQVDQHAASIIVLDMFGLLQAESLLED